ncbi:unnamed protein product [Prorocentrum cordatum]|uniref:Uncharacterized protein n=1 Tax=Prorocentrum cordatum TaxID=2364126 RepID=A0ABN9YEX3_9DINO|nr:unnamed protein product [Polarella glacialis]
MQSAHNGAATTRIAAKVEERRLLRRRRARGKLSRARPPRLNSGARAQPSGEHTRICPLAGLDPRGHGYGYVILAQELGPAGQARGACTEWRSAMAATSGRGEPRGHAQREHSSGDAPNGDAPTPQPAGGGASGPTAMPGRPKRPVRPRDLAPARSDEPEPAR